MRGIAPSSLRRVAAVDMAFSFLTTVVPIDGFRDPGANPTRRAWAKEFLDWASERRVQLVSFPAGFLRGRDRQSALEVASPVLAQARAAGLAVVLGVDLGDKLEAVKARAAGPHPFWIVAQQADGLSPLIFQQPSIRATDHITVDPIQLLKERTFVVAGRTIGLIACGEAFNASIREALRHVDLAVVSAHTALRSRHPRTLAAMGRNGTPRSARYTRPTQRTFCGPRRNAAPLRVSASLAVCEWPASSCDKKWPGFGFAIRRGRERLRESL